MRMWAVKEFGRWRRAGNQTWQRSLRTDAHYFTILTRQFLRCCFYCAVTQNEILPFVMQTICLFVETLYALWVILRQLRAMKSINNTAVKLANLFDAARFLFFFLLWLIIKVPQKWTCLCLMDSNQLEHLGEKLFWRSFHLNLIYSSLLPFFFFMIHPALVLCL